MCVELPDDYEIIEVEAPSKVIGRTLEDIGLRKKYNLNMVTVLKKTVTGEGDEEKTEHHIYGVPGPDSTVAEGDMLVLFGLNNDVNRFIEINA